MHDSNKMRANGKDTFRSVTKRPPALSSKKNSTDQRDGGIPKPRPASAHGRTTGLQNKKSQSSPNSLMKATAAPRSLAGAISPRYLIKGRRFGNDESKLRSPKCSPKLATRDAQRKVTNTNAINKRLSVGGNDASPVSDSASDKDSYSNIPASPSIASDSCSEIMDMERSGFLFSLLNLDGEDSQWISDIESERDPFNSGFTSPPHQRASSFDFHSCSSASSMEVKNVKSPCSFSSEDISESTEWEDFSNDDPVFWPLQQRVDWNSEKAEDCFCMSPSKNISSPSCKDMKKTGHVKDAPKCIEPKFPGTNIDPKTIFSCRRRLAFGSGKLASKILEWERKIATNMTNAIEAKPSRLSKSTEDAVKMDCIDIEDNVIEPRDQNDIMHKLVDADRKLLEEILKSSNMNLIETLVGLSEFDGHEGISSDVSRDVFILE